MSRQASVPLGQTQDDSDGDVEDVRYDRRNEELEAFLVERGWSRFTEDADSPATSPAVVADARTGTQAEEEDNQPLAATQSTIAELFRSTKRTRVSYAGRKKPAAASLRRLASPAKRKRVDKMPEVSLPASTHRIVPLSTQLSQLHNEVDRNPTLAAPVASSSNVNSVHALESKFASADGASDSTDDFDVGALSDIDSVSDSELSDGSTVSQRGPTQSWLQSLSQPASSALAVPPRRHGRKRPAVRGLSVRLKRLLSVPLHTRLSDYSSQSLPTLSEQSAPPKAEPTVVAVRSCFALPTVLVATGAVLSTAEDASDVKAGEDIIVLFSIDMLKPSPGDQIQIYRPFKIAFSAQLAALGSRPAPACTSVKTSSAAVYLGLPVLFDACKCAPVAMPTGRPSG